QTLFADNKGLLRTKSISGPSIPITLCEISPNSGIFSDYDVGGIADILMLNHASRDKSFTIVYNDNSYSIVVKYYNATLTMG
ncbi:MAG: hypothetical protein ACREBB_06265, partial [Nitrosotalea sp.]